MVTEHLLRRQERSDQHRLPAHPVLYCAVGHYGVTATNLRVQQDTGSGFTNVPLTDSSGSVVATVGVDDALPSGGARGVTLQMRAIKGTPAGTLTMGASLLTSADGISWATLPLATATQSFTVTNQSAPTATTTTVTASSVLTDSATGVVTMTATVSPSVGTGNVTGTGMVTFLDNGNPVRCRPL